MRSLKFVLIYLVLILPLIEMPQFCYANAVSADQYEKVAVVLVIDTSGSMKQTDPNHLRGTAANIFIDLLSPDDYLGVITFDTSVDTVLPMEIVKGNQNRTVMKETLSPRLVSAGDTNYQIALAEAKKQLDGLKENDIRKAIVFLTDGKPDPDPSQSNDSSFMARYMNSLWEIVSDLSISNYPVYSIGFGSDINPGVLQKISNDTRGEYLGIRDAAELASSFFRIQSKLKNRAVFLNSEMEVKKEKKIDFDLDRDTSQITFVFTYPENNPFDITLVKQNGQSIKSGTEIRKEQGYTTVTLNQNLQEQVGKWQIAIMGNGTLKAFGAKDSFIKVWMKSPAPNSILSMHEQLNIEAVVTGKETNDLYVETLISKNGVKEINPIILKYKSGVYQGLYDKTDQPGDYTVETRVLQSGRIVASSTSKVSVKAIPVLNTDFYPDQKRYVQGSKSMISAWLSVNDNTIITSEKLKINSFKIILQYQGDKKTSIVLSDDGNMKNGDVKSADGVYSTILSYDNAGKVGAILEVKGIYNGESFTLSEPVGSFSISPPGSVSIMINSKLLVGRNGKMIDIPLQIDNKSEFTQLIHLSVSNSFGKFTIPQMSVPKGITEMQVSLVLNDKLTEGIHTIPISVTTEEPLTELKSDKLTLELQVVSGFEWYLRKTFTILSMLTPILLIPVILILTGLLLYRLLVYPRTIVHGVLRFYESFDQSDEGKELKLSSKKKSRIIISMNGENKNDPFKGQPSICNYNILLVNEFEIGRWKFIEGFKALNKNYKKPVLMLQTTEPGIFQYNGRIYTKKEINHGDIFESGGYTFQYFENGKADQYDTAKDLLEGKL